MSTKAKNQPRQPKGVPTGGQWRATNRPEGRAVLCEPVDDPWRAARERTLPPSFDRWDISDKEGRTVAHVAAGNGSLPPDFDRWDISDHYGWTVGHTAAASGHLPPDFDRWDLLSS